MLQEKYLLARYEELLEGPGESENGTTRTNNALRKKVAELLELEPIVKDILAVIIDQRTYRDERGLTLDIPHVDPLRREEYMAREPHIISYFAERAFSLPIDYRVANKEGKKKENYRDLVESIVIQPEFLSDDFLVSLGLMKESEKKTLTPKEKVERKIALIPHIKGLLYDLEPLKLNGQRTTGRISQVTNPKSPHFGAYMVFQEVSEIEKNKDKIRRSKKRVIVPRIIRDHYSLLRSQRYATTQMQKKIKFLTELRDDLIPAILLRWQRKDYSQEEKQRDRATLIVELENSLSYYERRALEDRIKKIDFKNSERDGQRLNGAYRDIAKAIADIIAKNNEISAQTEWIRNSERQMRNPFELFYEEAMIHIPDLNRTLQGVDLRGMEEDQNLRGDQTHEFNSFLRVIERFSEQIALLPQIGNPYHTLPGLIVNYREKMKSHRSWRKGAIGKEGIRLTLAFFLELKKIRYQVMMKEAEYRMKVRGEGMTQSEKENLQKKVIRVRDSLENTRFLPDIDLKPEGQEKFEGMIGALRELEESLSFESKETGE